MLTRNILPLALLGAFAAGSAQSAVLIDNFDVAPQTAFGLSAPGAPNTAADPGAGLNIIGGWRTIQVTAATGNVFATADTAPTPGAYSHSNPAGATGTSLITWDNAGSGLGGVDLTAGGATALILDITSIDQGNVTLTFSVTDLLANTSSISLNGLGVGLQGFLFSGFTGSADFTQVDSISLEVAGGLASDLTLDLIGTNTPPSVPEPASLALFGVGMLGLLASRKKNRA